MSFIDPYNIHTGPVAQRNALLGGQMYSNYDKYTGTYGGVPSTSVGGVPSGGGGGVGPAFDSLVNGVNLGAGGTAGNVNAQNRANQALANRARIPDAQGLEEQSSSMIADQLMGKIPEDVLAMLGQGAGERAVGSGMVGAPASEAAYRRALGLTSIGQQEAGQRNLTAALGRNPAAPLYNAGELVLTPAQQAQLDLERQRLDLERLRIAKMGSGGGGGGGGGGTRIVDDGQGTTTPGRILTGADLFDPAAGRGTMTTRPPATDEGSITDYFNGGWLDELDPWSNFGGTQPSEADQYFNGGWLDEIDPYYN